jgi:peroxiredoxin
MNATVVAVTPQLPEHNRTMRDKNALNFHLLTDPGNGYAATLGLRHGVDGDLRDVYKGLNIDLPRYNGDESWTLPVPARLVVDQTGVIRAADVDADYTRRPEPEDTIAKLRALL